MNKRYAALKKQFDAVSEEIVSASQKVIDAEQRIGEGQECLLSMREALKSAVTIGDKARTDSLEIQLVEQEKLIRRDEILIEATHEAITGVEQKQDVIQADIDQLFIELAEIWLKKQLDDYDKAAKEVIGHRSRLLSCYEILREKNHSEVYQDTLGEAFRFIPGIKIPLIKGFNQQEFLNGRQGNPGAVKDSVYNEILEGK